MENFLAQQLPALGGDAQLRKHNLLNLVPCLTQQEVRDLAARLVEVDFRTDIVRRLPPELRANVAGQFGQLDVFPLLNVSRQWREMWLEPDLLKILAEQCRYLDFDLWSEEAARQQPVDWTTPLYNLIRRRRRRFLGRFSSALVVCHDVGNGHGWLKRDLDLVGVFPPVHGGGLAPSDVFSRTEAPRLQHCESLYEAGRLAWVAETLPSPDNTLIVVEDLRTRTKKVYRNSSVSLYGRDMDLRALGDKLLVAGASRVMFIWNLESNRCSQISLPQPPSCVVSKGDHVAFLHRDSAFVWESGSGLEALNIDPVLERNQQIINRYPAVAIANTMGIFFHPFEAGTLFITVCFNDIRQVFVHKFTRAGYVETLEINLREIPALSHVKFNEKPRSVLAGGTLARRSVRPVNSSGDFLVAEWRTFTPCWGNASNNTSGMSAGQAHDPYKVHIHGSTFLELRFNVKTCDFSFVEKSMPSGSWGNMYALDLGDSPLLPSWNDQMTFALQATRPGQGHTAVGLAQAKSWDLALAVMPACRSTSADEVPPIYSVQPPKSSYVQHGRSAPSRAPCIVTVQEHLAEHSPDLALATGLTFVTEEDHVYTLKQQFLDADANVKLVKSLYAESDFVLDLTPILSFPGGGSSIEDLHYIFQDDDFIVLCNCHGYIAWDFRVDDSTGVPRGAETGGTESRDEDREAS